MGLAASQARFLAITARKMNCEFQSMQIAQEKLSVTRDLQRVSQDYQNSLNATKLVWDADEQCDGSGDIYQLSYGVMMTPSVLNEYDPYLITDSLGRILLSDGMFNAAVQAGVINSKGNPTTSTTVMGNISSQTDGSRNAFLYQLGQVNQIDSSIADAIKNKGESGYTKSGIGGPVYDKTSATAMQTNMFINYMKDITYGEAAEKQGLPIPEDFDAKDKIYNLKLSEVIDLHTDGKIINPNVVLSTNSNDLTDKSTIDTEDGTSATAGDGKLVITKAGQVLSADAVDKLTVGDLLTGKYTLTMNPKNTDAETLYNNIIKQIAIALGLDSLDYKGLNVDYESGEALKTAVDYMSTYATAVDGGSNTLSALYNKADATNNIVKSTNGEYYSFSLSNMAKAFLTQFALILDGYEAGYKVDSETKKSNYVTNDPSYYFLLKKDSSVTDTTMLNADFYNMLYNQIATNGAISDSNMRQLYTQDQVSLQQAIKNGNLFISTLHNDGYYYQGAYTNSGHVAEIIDEDAIARAELEYNVQKAKLNHKEETLELQMKNLDMEISSLTTELDSVKNLISKNVEKVFNMFSS